MQTPFRLPRAMWQCLCRSRRIRTCSILAEYFSGYAGFDDSEPPFDPSFMVHFRKRLTPEILAEINEMVIREAKGKGEDDDDKPGGGNSGTMIVDATCAPSNIRYPQDVSLLN